MAAGFGYVYETLLVDRGTSLGLSVSTVPPISVPALHGSDAASAAAQAIGTEVLREAKDRDDAVAALAAILAGATPNAIGEYYDGMARQRTHKEVATEPAWVAASRLVDLEVIPIESSPLRGTSISSLIDGAALGPAVGYVAMSAGAAPAMVLLLAGAFGIVIVSAATGVGEGLRERLRRWAAGESESKPQDSI